jgi:hypothetical protein
VILKGRERGSLNGPSRQNSDDNEDNDTHWRRAIEVAVKKTINWTIIAWDTFSAVR